MMRKAQSITSSLWCLSGNLQFSSNRRKPVTLDLLKTPFSFTPFLLRSLDTTRNWIAHSPSRHQFICEAFVLLSPHLVRSALTTCTLVKAPTSSRLISLSDRPFPSSLLLILTFILIWVSDRHVWQAEKCQPEGLLSTETGPSAVQELLWHFCLPEPGGWEGVRPPEPKWTLLCAPCTYFYFVFLSIQTCFSQCLIQETSHIIDLWFALATTRFNLKHFHVQLNTLWWTERAFKHITIMFVANGGSSYLLIGCCELLLQGGHPLQRHP